MRNKNYLNLIWIILIVVLCVSYTFSQSENYLNNLEEIKTNIKNPIAVIPITKFDNDESLVKYIVRTDDQLLFVDEEFNIIKTRKIQPGEKTNIELSKQCKYLLLYEILLRPEKGINGKQKITLIDYKGNEYWSKENQLIWDIRKYIQRFISDDNGYVIVLVEDDSISVSTIDKNGKERNRHNLFPDLDHWEGMGIYYDITTSGKYIAVLVNKYTPVTQAILRRTPLRGPDKGKEIVKKREFQDGEPTLFLFNSNGDLLSEKRCEGNKAEKVIITNNDSPMVVVTTVDIDSKKELTEKVKTNVYDLNLNFLYSLPVRSIRYCIIDSLIIISYCDLKSREPVLSAFAISNGTKIWTMPLEQFPFFIYANDDGNEIHLLSSSQPTFDNPIERFFLRSYNTMGVKLSDDFLGVELNHTGLGYNSREYVWGKSLYVINNKIYVKQ